MLSSKGELAVSRVRGEVIKSFVMHPGSKIEKNYEQRILDACWHTICRGFKVHDLITGE